MPGPEPRDWGPLTALVWIASRDDAATVSARDFEAAREARSVDLPRFFGERDLEIAEHNREGCEGRYVDPAIPLLVLSRIDPTMQLAPKSAVEAVPGLMTELANGRRLRASGLADNGNARVPVPVSFWTRASAHLLGTPDYPYLVFADGNTVWTDLLLRMHDVKRCWQPLGRGERMARRPTDPAVTDWYRQRVANWPEGRASPSVNDDWADAKHDLPLEPSRDQIAAIRQQLAPAAWKKRGRRAVKLDS